MRTTLVLLALLSGLTLANATSNGTDTPLTTDTPRATEAPSAADTPQPGCRAHSFLELDDQARNDRLQTGVGAIQQASREVEDHLESLPAEELAELRRQAAFVVQTCPYNGTVLEVFRTYRESLAGIEDERLRPFQDALAAQWKVLDTLGVTSLRPLGKEFDRATLTAHMETVRESVEALGPETMEQLDQAHAALKVHTGDLWLSKPAFIQHRQELEELVASVVATEPAPRPTGWITAARELNELFSGLIALYC